MSRDISVTFKDDEPLYFNIQGNHFHIEHLQQYFPFATGLYYEYNNHTYVVDIINNGLQLPTNISNFKLLYQLEDITDNTNQKIELVKEYFFKKYIYQEISGVLKKKHNIKLSVRSIRRIVKRESLRRKNVIESPIEAILSTLIFEIDNTTLNLGYRAMTHRLKSQYHLLVKRSTVLKLMRFVDAEGVEARSKYRLKRRLYAAHGPNYAWHIDGHDKLKPFGFSIHGCVDGFSRMVIWLRVATTNKNPKIMAYYYLQCIKKFGFISSIMVSDKGTENTVVDVLHIALRTYHTDEHTGEKSFKKGKSTSNERIEKYWKQLRESTLDYFIDLFKTMQENSILDIQSEIHLECLRFCFSSLMHRSLDKAKTEWNEHRIQKQKMLSYQVLFQVLCFIGLKSTGTMTAVKMLMKKILI